MNIWASNYYVPPMFSCHWRNIYDTCNVSALFDFNFSSILAKNKAAFSLIAFTFVLNDVSSVLL